MRMLHKNSFPNLKRRLTRFRGLDDPRVHSKNFDECNCSEAMFWCHPCGFAYCLECRISGLACNHNSVNYLSELPAEFLPDGISSKGSPFDIEVLIDAVLAESSFFGATRSEHAVNRQENFQDLITHLREGRALGNTYLKSFARYGIEQFDYTGLFIQCLTIKEFLV